jgi:hypothetical protein
MIRPMREITVGVVAPAYVNIPLWVAQRRGYLERRGPRAAGRILGTTLRVTLRAADGGVDIVCAPEGVHADAVVGSPLRVVAGLIDRPPLSMIAIPRHRTFGDLRGGRIDIIPEGGHPARRGADARCAWPDLPGRLRLRSQAHMSAMEGAARQDDRAALQMIPYDDAATDISLRTSDRFTEEFALNARLVSLPAERADHALPAGLAGQRNGSVATSRVGDYRGGAYIDDPRCALRACQALAADGVIPGWSAPGPSRRRSSHCGQRPDPQESRNPRTPRTPRTQGRRRRRHPT